VENNNAQNTLTEGAEQTTNQPAAQQPATANEIDYEKLANIVAGATSAKENAVLKNYFKQQGLSQEDAEKAMSTYRQQQEAKKPDVNALQAAVTEAKKQAADAVLKSAVITAAVELGWDTKSIPYLLKLADLGGVVGEDGTVNDEALKAAINKVSEDLPELKPGNQQAATGFKIGAPEGSTGFAKNQTGSTVQKRWNKFNH